tara:strand:- start:262 stop:537 length:276 start_codon:yes stop_codon:yes gene_type:complete
MFTKCILEEINLLDDMILLKTSRGEFKINIINGSSEVPIYSYDNDYLGLQSLKKDSSLKIYHDNNNCKKIIINENYEFLSSEDSIINLTDT